MAYQVCPELVEPLRQQPAQLGSISNKRTQCKGFIEHGRVIRFVGSALFPVHHNESFFQGCIVGEQRQL